jgi:hypothetical protein
VSGVGCVSDSLFLHLHSEVAGRTAVWPEKKIIKKKNCYESWVRRGKCVISLGKRGLFFF